MKMIGMMRRVALGSFCAALSAGCATDVRDSANAGVSGNVMTLAFQNPALDPRNGGKLVQVDALVPGDIILSATDGITSAGIRLLTLSPVSHALLYLGDDQIAEAVGEGIRVRKIGAMLEEEAVVVAFRHPRLDVAHREKLRRFALQNVGSKYNYLGVMLHAPFSLERRACELPLMPESIRDFCMRGVAAIQLGTGSNQRFFCSQFVLEAYRHAGLPITDANPRWISPADILHMREGDVPSIKIPQTLTYIGHLKYRALPRGADQSARQ